MPNLSDLVAYQSAVGDLSTLTIAELVAFWQSLDTDNAVGAASDMREFVPDLIDTYAPMSAEIAATFYDDSRAKADVKAGFFASIFTRPNPKLQDMIGWAVAPLFRTATRDEAPHVGGSLVTVPAPDPTLALSRLSSGVQLEVADAARETIERNADDDPEIARFARHASANACAFCALMATRGAVYRTAASAGNGNKYHANCHCVAYPVFVGEVDESPAYVLTWETAYRDARKSARKAGIKAPGLKDVLPYMRQSLGAA